MGWKHYLLTIYANNYLKTIHFLGGGRPGLVVMDDDSCLKGCGFES